MERTGTASPTAYAFPLDLAWDDWREIGAALGLRTKAWRWHLGDWLVMGRKLYGEQVTQALDVTGLTVPTLMALAWVAVRIPPERRHAELSWSHHRDVAPLEAEEQTDWLRRAAEGDWTITALRAALREAGRLPPQVRNDLERAWRLVESLSEGDREELVFRMRQAGYV